MKLLLNPASEAKWCTHDDTGARFNIRPIDPAKYEEIRRKSLRSDKSLDISRWGANFAAAAIADWEGVGSKIAPAECCEETLRIFGANQAVNIMPWVIEQATSLEQYRDEEEAAAKNA